MATSSQAAPGGAATPTEGLTTRRYELPMAAQDPNAAHPEEKGVMAAPQPERPKRPVRVFGTVKIYHQCGFFKCDEPAIAAVPIQTPEDIGVWWLCEQHADILPWHEGIGGRHDAPTVYNISRTCRYNSLGPDNPPCGAAADYLAVTLFRDADVPYLATVSLCERHASGLVGQ